MRRTAVALAALALAAACAPRQVAPPPPRPELRYYVKRAGDGPLLAVTLVAENLRSDSLDFTFPVWLPGDYRPIEPGKWVEDVRAHDRTTRELPVRRLGPNAWRLYPRGAAYFLVSYTLHPVRPDGFKRSLISELAPDGGYFTGAVAFGYLRGLETHPVSLTFELGPRAPVACSLEAEGSARFRAANAHELAHAGCAYGERIRELRTTVRGVPHRLVLAAPPGFDADTLLGVVREVAEAQALLLGRLPYPEYTLFVHLVDPATSGLGGSPLFRGSAYYLPEIHPDRIRPSGIPALLAHQIFHAWNLGSVPPADLARPPLDRPVASRAMWLVEGLAEHYARVSLSRARVLPRAELYASIARDLRALSEEPAAARANLETASVATSRAEARDALARKSPLAVLALDVELRRATANAVGTDSLLRWLEGAGRPEPVPYDSIVGWLLARGGGGTRALYASSIAGSEPLPVEAVLTGAGLELVTREVEELNLGASLLPAGDGSFRFRSVVPQGIGGRMGLRAGDRLVAVNQQPVSRDNLLPLLAVLADLKSGLRTGKPVTVRVERDGREVDLRGRLEPWRREVPLVVESGRASDGQVAVREAIFSGAPPRSEAHGG